MGSAHSMGMLEKGIPILDTTEWGSVRCPHVTQNVVLFKAPELFLSGIFHLLFSHHGWLWVTETEDRETTDKGEILYNGIFPVSSFKSVSFTFCIFGLGTMAWTQSLVLARHAFSHLNNAPSPTFCILKYFM
jgi:hypothetical protein